MRGKNKSNNTLRNAAPRMAKTTLVSLNALEQSLESILADPTFKEKLPAFNSLDGPKLIINDNKTWQIVMQSLINLERFFNETSTDASFEKKIKQLLIAWNKGLVDNELFFAQDDEVSLPLDSQRLSHEQLSNRSGMSLSLFMKVLLRIDEFAPLTPIAEIKDIDRQQKIAKLFTDNFYTQINNQLSPPSTTPNDLYNLSDIHQIMTALDTAKVFELVRTPDFANYKNNSYWQVINTSIYNDFFSNLTNFSTFPPEYFIAKVQSWQNDNDEENNAFGLINSIELGRLLYTQDDEWDNTDESICNFQGQALINMRYLCNEMGRILKKKDIAQLHPELSNKELAITVSRFKVSIYAECARYNVSGRERGEEALTYLKPVTKIKR